LSKSRQRLRTPTALQRTLFTAVTRRLLPGFSLISVPLGEGRLDEAARELIANGVRGLPAQAAPMVDSCRGARSSGCVGLNGSRFGRTDSAKELEAGTMTANLQARTAQDSDTPATPVFAAPIRHPSAWTVADFRSPADYSVDLAAAQLRDIAAAMQRIKAAGIGLDGLQREHFEVPSLRPIVEEVRRQLEDGRGLVLLRRLPVEDYSKDDLGLIFWGIGTHLGRGLSQSVMGDRLGHVKDFSREDPGARAYRNKQELSPHTDSCDLVGLL